ncbi:MAG TPA: ABC transporter ATP-binding protein [Chloroflexia bacterium]|nr:ABC transporter ATP-binding protein [Chloroflexia bacterium]
MTDLTVSPSNSNSPLLQVEDLGKTFGQRPPVHAVRGMSFSINKGQTFGLVGESGSGKSTTGRLVLRLIEPTTGRVLFNGRDLGKLAKQEMRQQRRHMQMIFQDPYGSLNPYMTIRETLEEPLMVHGLMDAPGRKNRVESLVSEVGLPRTALEKYPHEFSGGQRQRIAIARALVTEPELIVADEPVSALDVSVQAQVLNLLLNLQEQHKMSLLFISHDLRVVEFMCDEIAVMYLGQIMERGPRAKIYKSPQHPYTRALLESIPGNGKRQASRLQGEIPSPSAIPSGCPFRTRCPLAFDRCATEKPPLYQLGLGHVSACHLAAPGAGSENTLTSNRKAEV